MKLAVSKINPNFFVVTEPTDLATVKAQELTKRNGAKIQADGRIVVNQVYRSEFEWIEKQSRMAPKSQLGQAMAEQGAEWIDQVWYA